MCELLSKFALSLTLKSSRGKSRRSRAIPSSAATLGSKSSRAPTSRPSGRASSAFTAPSSCSIRERLGICTLHLRSQLLQRAKLQLLHRSFAFPKLLRNLPNTPLLDETPEDHASLLERKFFHQAKQPCSSLHCLLFWSAALLWRVFHIYRLARRTFGLIGNCVRGNAEQPGRKRCSPPLVIL